MRLHILNATLTDGKAWKTQQHLNQGHERDVHGLLLRLQLQVRCGHHKSHVIVDFCVNLLDSTVTADAMTVVVNSAVHTSVPDVAAAAAAAAASATASDV